MPDAEPLEAVEAPKAPEPVPAVAFAAPPKRLGGALFDTGMGAGMGSPVSLIRQLARSSVTDRKAGIDDLNGRVGNRVVSRWVARPGVLSRRDPAAPAAAPAPARSKEGRLAVKLAAPVTFKTASVKSGTLEVSFSGRLSIVDGRVVLIGEELPRKGLADRVKTIVEDAMAKSVPTAAGTTFEFAIGKHRVQLELSKEAEKAGGFKVGATFAPPALNFDACEITLGKSKEKEIRLDVTAHVGAAAKPPAAAAPAAPAPAPVEAPAPAGAAPSPAAPAAPAGPAGSQPAAAPAPAAPPAAGASAVVRFALDGLEANFATKGRSGAVVPQAMIDEFLRRAPKIVKENPFFKSDEQLVGFFAQMRAYFGTDERTIAHFEKIRRTDVPGGMPLHEEAASRLEAVQKELGRAEMPLGGAGWPRSQHDIRSDQGLGNLHNLGFAVDYNAIEAPHIDDKSRLRQDLIREITGRSASFNAAPPKGLDPRKMGETALSGTTAEKEALEQDAQVRAYLDGIEKEAQALSDASERLRGSLKTKDDEGNEVDNRVRLNRLREEYFAAKSKADKEKVVGQLPAVLAPWLAKLEESRQRAEKAITDAGADASKLPTGAKLTSSARSVWRLNAQLQERLTSVRGRTDPPSKTETRQLESLIKRAQAALPAGAAPAAEPDVVKRFEKVAEALDKHAAALANKTKLERLPALKAALSDPTVIFGRSAADTHSTPGMAQMADIGFFTLRDHSSRRQAFTPEFVRSMVKHGFHLGASWSTPDYMHFELRWKGPGMK